MMRSMLEAVVVSFVLFGVGREGLFLVMRAGDA
jgi:hypothetical protein